MEIATTIIGLLGHFGLLKLKISNYSQIIIVILLCRHSGDFT